MPFFLPLSPVFRGRLLLLPPHVVVGSDSQLAVLPGQWLFATILYIYSLRMYWATHLRDLKKFRSLYDSIWCPPLPCKVSNEALKEAVTQIAADSKEKRRNFPETIELQIGLKNYDPKKNKRFSGSVKFPHIPKPKMKVCMLGDAQHVEEASMAEIREHASRRRDGEVH